MIVDGGGEDPLKSRRREIVVVMCDLRGFTAFAETSEPEEMMRTLGAYHAAMGRLVLAHEATLERFTGDGMMVFLGDPVPVDNAAQRAVALAVAMREAALELSATWKKRGVDLGLGIGIAQGFATVGAIGFEGRIDYGAIGTVTNLAAPPVPAGEGGRDHPVAARVRGSGRHDRRGGPGRAAAARLRAAGARVSLHGPGHAEGPARIARPTQSRRAAIRTPVATCRRSAPTGDFRPGGQRDS